MNRTESCYKKVPNMVTVHQPKQQGVPIRCNMQITLEDGTKHMMTRREYKGFRATRKAARRNTNRLAKRVKAVEQQKVA